MSKPVMVRFLNDKLEKEYLALSEKDHLKKRIDWIIERLKKILHLDNPSRNDLFQENM